MTATKDDQISTKTQFLFKCWIVKITSNFEQRGEKKKENIKAYLKAGYNTEMKHQCTNYLSF